MAKKRTAKKNSYSSGSKEPAAKKTKPGHKKAIKQHQKEPQEKIPVSVPLIQEPSAGEKPYLTIIDEIYDDVRKSGKADLSALAKKYRLTVSQMEEWAKVLDKSGLLEFVYPVVGEPVLQTKTLPVAKQEEKIDAHNKDNTKPVPQEQPKPDNNTPAGSVINPPPPKKPRTRKLILLGGIIVIVALIILLVYLLIQQGTIPKPPISIQGGYIMLG